jgi:exosortase
MNRTSSRAIAFGIYSLCLVAGTVGVLRELVVLSRGNETASHVIAVPAVTLVLMFQSRERIFSNVRWALPGLGVIGLGLAALIWSTLSPTHADALSIKVAGLVTAWVGGFYLFFGPAAFRAALFPLLFLGFTIPIPETVIAGATQVLKVGSTEAVAALFSVTGTPYFREGFVFSLPTFVIEVADECSGIRSTIALGLTGLLAGYAFLTRPWTKAFLLVVILPVTILKNGVRIVTLTLLAMHVDPSFLVGQLHHEGGVVFFVLGLGMLAPVVFLLRRLESSPGSADVALR